jgi:hypothetical protein
MSGRVDVKRVQAGREFGLQGVVDGAMLRQPGEPGEGRRAYLHRVMCLASGRCARVTVVEM